MAWGTIQGCATNKNSTTILNVACIQIVPHGVLYRQMLAVLLGEPEATLRLHNMKYISFMQF